MTKKNNKKSFLEKFKLPAMALAVIAVIYGGLILRDFSHQINNLKSQNQTMSFQATELSAKLDKLQNETETVKTANNNLAINLADAQKQIVNLRNSINIKKAAVAPATFQTAVVTKTITQTVTQEVEKNQATVTVGSVGSFKVDLQAGDNAFEVLKRAAQENNFALDYDVYSFGVFVKSIAGASPQGNQYWAFYFNGSFSNVGASDQPVTKGDSIFWQLTNF